MWITNGCVDEDTLGDVFLIYARTGEGSGGLSMFLVEKGDEGFSLGTKIKVGVFQVYWRCTLNSPLHRSSGQVWHAGICDRGTCV